MTLLQNTSFIRYGFSTTLSPSGGVAPFTWNVVAGGAGGSVDSSGKYTAPQQPFDLTDINKTIDTIRVVDANGDVATATMNVLTPLEIVCEIIRRELSLDNEQVWIYDQKRNIPIDSKLYVVVEVINPKPFGSSNKSEVIEGVLTSVQGLNMAVMLSIDVMSRSLLALYRKEEVILALNSDFARQMQQAYSFYIAPLTTQFVAISQEDGAAIPYRFAMSVTIQYAVTKKRPVAYFDQFQGNLITDPETPNEPVVFLDSTDE